MELSKIILNTEAMQVDMVVVHGPAMVNEVVHIISMEMMELLRYHGPLQQTLVSHYGFIETVLVQIHMRPL